MTTHSYYPDDVFIRTSKDLPEDYVFVFGSNYAGRHGAGAAKLASWYFGAVFGEGQGFGIQNRSYAIPTKDERIQTLPLEIILGHVEIFTAATHDELHQAKTFFVTKVGCGLAGYTSEDIAPMFSKTRSCVFPQSWRKFLE